MRISLIYGEDLPKAYAKFIETIEASKKKGFQITEIYDLKKIVTQSLFEEKGVFVLNKPNKVKLADWKWLSINASKYNSNLLIYYDGTPAAYILKSLPKDSKIEKFDLPKLIFTFLDSFWPGNSKKSLNLLNEVTKSEPIELVFHLLSRHIRDLYWAKASKESMQIPDWRIIKLSNQAGRFSIEKITEVISELADIDIKYKTSSEDLKSLLDILIVEQLE